MGRQKVQVWIVSRTREGWKVLLLHMLPERGSHWQPVTGSVEPGEALPQAALREAGEETGLSLESAALQPLGFEFEFEKSGIRLHETAFWIESRLDPSTASVKLDPREHFEFRWCSFKEATALLSFESNRESLHLLQSRLGEQV